MLYGFDSKPIMKKNDKLILTPGFGLLCFGLNYFPDSDIKYVFILLLASDISKYKKFHIKMTSKTEIPDFAVVGPLTHLGNSLKALP